MPVPLIIFGLYCGLIAKQLDAYLDPIQSFSISISKQFKQISILVLISSLSILYFSTYGKWIITYERLERINQLGELDQIATLETPIHYSGMQQTLYRLGGKYFNKGDYHRSKSIDIQFLKVWPNHLDVLFRAAYAKNKLGQNDEALELAKKLKKLEPNGLYNGYIVEMFVYLSLNELEKLETTFNELISKPQEFLKLNDDTYRFLIFFTLASKNLYDFAPILYKKYIANHGYSCEVENNLAIHYFNIEQYHDSSKHVNNTFGKARDCLNPKLIKLLEERKLTES
jgi:tetratricopeptide (TPR) repeat protein